MLCQVVVVGGGQYFYFKNIEDPHFSIFDRNINAFIHI